MDPITLGGIFLGLAGGISSLFSTDKANQIAEQNQTAETQLLTEAHQQEAQMAEGKVLVGQRTGQEEQVFGGPTNKWTATDTLLGGLSPVQKTEPTMKSLDTPNASLLGV
jgi:hypothetical protein